MKNITKYFIYIIIFGGVLFFSYQLYNKDKTLDRKIFDIEYKLIQDQEIIAKSASEKLIGLQMENTKIPSEQISYDSLNAIPILRLHNEICLSCYTYNIKYLLNSFEKSGLDLVVLGTYPSDAMFQKNTHDLGIENNIQIINDKKCHLIADTEKSPYLFTLSKENKITKVFFINKNDTLSIIEYINMLNRS